MMHETGDLSKGLPPSSRGGAWSLASAKQRSDAELIERIAAGNRLAMQVLYLRHNKRVFRFICRFINDTAAAEDLTSEAFLQVWRNAGRFEARSQVLTWMLSIARNKALGALRHRSAELFSVDNAALIEDPAEDPEVSIEKKDQTVALRHCLELLSPAHREIIDLVYYHQQSIGAAAEILGISPGTVKTRMFHARKRLAHLIARNYSELQPCPNGTHVPDIRSA
jgi:RNA polymerase sigma-70 factor (ECF subfamily)